MSGAQEGWRVVFSGRDPAAQGQRESLCTLGNGRFATRGAPPDSSADGTHYPGTYLAGGYNRLTSDVEGHELRNEDLVNIPNWLPLTFRIGDGEWVRAGGVAYRAYEEALDLKGGVLERSLEIEDGEGRRTKWRERRFVSMDDPHLAGIELRLTPLNWSGPMAVRSGVDGGVVNGGVPRYRALSSRHLETLATERTADDAILLRSRMVQSRREVVVAARTRTDGETGRRTIPEADEIAQEITLDAVEGREITVEKIVSVRTSRDDAIAEAGTAAAADLAVAASFATLLARHIGAWADLWEECDVDVTIAGDHGWQAERAKIKLHIFHLLQTVTEHSVDLDIGVPPRGWTGEAYRGHIMWDELFIFPYLNLRKPSLTRALLRYRDRRLPAAVAAAREHGHAGAMFPWQSGSDGTEESQKLHLNPASGRWIPDDSQRQRHVGAAVAYNVWQYYQATGDRIYLHDFGAELILSIAQFWASIAVESPEDRRYHIAGVMGPDEFHTAYPGAAPDKGGLTDNAYTNVMAAWVLARGLDVIDLLAEDRRQSLCRKLGIDTAERMRWDEISRGLAVPFREDGIISQFHGYDELQEFDWEVWRAKYDNLHRLDRLLEAEGLDPNAFKVSKQADVLMLFYLFSAEELGEIFERLGYAFSPELIFRNIHYYLQRTSHGSTLSAVAHAWVLARSDRERSWQLFCNALDSDIRDLQGGTTREGLHLGAMAGTVDLLQRCYTGLEIRYGVLMFNPRLPRELERLRTKMRFRGQTLEIDVTGDTLSVRSLPSSAEPVPIAYRGAMRVIGPCQSHIFRLVSPPAHDRAAKSRDMAQMGAATASARPAE